MVPAANTLLVLSIILFFGLVIPEFFKKLQLPFVSSLILAGALLGPHGIDYVVSNEAIELLSFLGSVFLMLMVGLEFKSLDFHEYREKILSLVLLNTTTPFLIGFAIVRLLGYSWEASLLTAIILMSSSFVVVLSTLRSLRTQYSVLGKVLANAVIVEDIITLLLLTLFMQYLQPTTIFPPFIYVGMLVCSFLLLRMFLPEILVYFFNTHKKDENEAQLRFVLAMVLIVLIFFSWIGVHPIVGAFFVGLLIGEVVKPNKLHKKLSVMAYGLFIPVFFFSMGMEVDLSVLAGVDTDVKVLVIVGSIFAAKYISGYVAARRSRFTSASASFAGLATSSKLTTTLSATYAALPLGILDTTLISAIIVLSLATTFMGPVAMAYVRKEHA